MSLPLSNEVADAVAAGRKAVSIDAAMIAKLTDMAGDFAINLTIAILIFIATLFAAKWASGAARRALSRVRGFRHDPTVLSFAVQVVRVVVIIVGMIAVLQRLGVQTTSIIAVLGAASLAVGLALQGTLSNVASGFMLLVLRPYRVGEVIDIGGVSGTVQRLDLFTTQLSNANNHKIVIPNSKVLSDPLTNLTGQQTRRIEIHFTVGYGDDLNQARQVLADVAGGHEDAGDRPEDEPRAETETPAGADPAAAAADVVRRHRLREPHITHGVEPRDEFRGVVLEIALDGEQAAVERAVRSLRLAPEPLLQLVRAAVGGVRDLAGEPEPRRREDALLEVAATPEIRVSFDCPHLRVPPRDLVGARRRAARDDEGALHPMREGRHPLRGAHPAEGAADDSVEARDAESVGDPRLGARLIPDADVWEAPAPHPAVWCERHGARAAATAAEHVDRHDEQLVGVEGRAGADETRPPPRRRLPGADRPDDVRVSGQGVLDEDGVARVVVQLAPALVRHDDVGQGGAVLQRQGADVDGTCVRVEPAVGEGRRGVGHGEATVRNHDILDSEVGRNPPLALAAHGRPCRHPGHPAAREGCRSASRGLCR